MRWTLPMSVSTMRHNGIPIMEYNIHAIRPPVVAGAMWPYPVEKAKF